MIDEKKEVNYGQSIGMNEHNARMVSPLFRRIFDEYDAITSENYALGDKPFVNFRKSLEETIKVYFDIFGPAVHIDDTCVEYLSDALTQTRKFEIYNIKFTKVNLFTRIWEKITGKRKSKRVLTITLNECYFTEANILELAEKMVNKYNNVDSFCIRQIETDLDKDFDYPLFASGGEFDTVWIRGLADEREKEKSVIKTSIEFAARKGKKLQEI